MTTAVAGAGAPTTLEALRLAERSSYTGALKTKGMGGVPSLVRLSVDSASEPALARGDAREEAVKMVQLALYSLGKLAKRTGIDGKFGAGTEASVKAFQREQQLPETGVVDGETLRRLDQVSLSNIRELEALRPQLPKRKRDLYEVAIDLTDLQKTRLYVLEKGTGKIVERYLTSPGKDTLETPRGKFVISRTLVRSEWHPTAGQIRRAQENGEPIPTKQPAGIDNPMGIQKFQFRNAAGRDLPIFIHGIPAVKEAFLGQAASSGCARVSGSNVLELGEKYIENGTQVTVFRNAADSKRLSNAFTAANGKDRATDAGRAYLFGYASGELGRTSRLEDGYVVPNT